MASSGSRNNGLGLVRKLAQAIVLQHAHCVAVDRPPKDEIHVAVMIEIRKCAGYRRCPGHAGIPRGFDERRIIASKQARPPRREEQDIDILVVVDVGSKRRERRCGAWKPAALGHLDEPAPAVFEESDDAARWRLAR